MLETEPRIVDTYVKTGRVKLQFRHLLDFGDGSLQASQAAECAGEQGRFWDMHRLIFQRQSAVFGATPAVFQKWATEDLKIDGTALTSCMASNKYKAKIERSHSAARSTDGVRTRPTFDINGKRLQGALPFAEFQKAIDSIQ